MHRGIKWLLIVGWVVYGVWLALYWFQQPTTVDVTSASSSLERCLAQARGDSARSACRAEWGQGLTDTDDEPDTDLFTPQRIGSFLFFLAIPALAVYCVGLVLVKITTRLRPDLRSPSQL